MMDKENKRVVEYEGRIYFALDGAGELLINYGTYDKSGVIEMANGKAVIEMKPGNGQSVIEVRNQDFK